ncbi:MAG: FHA domain-containing protein [Oscillatoriales cyanobacterium]|nr:MAG: FHA domain-containing protein [Oscillatoriales cyanobacterium]TAE02018.1 MAG: FHA domain-containing protein [Oscillatoriales cyanobacterium]TAF02826.1 MAG: FHA domain-containing protein [Oscillatoriales cyanobacterium]TAF37014.1 MAG: FHA domain-containing protein [Oscillatoriales cyanobacterium]TAF71284.1 MAG: FHA domain-containing protein [Oscillatoriales cyanobacterium]
MSSGFGSDPIYQGRLTPDNAKLLVRNSSSANQKFPLNQIRAIIGRSDAPMSIADIDLTECKIDNKSAISRHHAVIEWVEGKLQIIDLDSTNGTFVNGKKLLTTAPRQPSSPEILKTGDIIKLGNIELEVIADG